MTTRQVYFEKQKCNVFVGNVINLLINAACVKTKYKEVFSSNLKFDQKPIQVQKIGKRQQEWKRLILVKLKLVKLK